MAKAPDVEMRRTRGPDYTRVEDDLILEFLLRAAVINRGGLPEDGEGGGTQIPHWEAHLAGPGEDRTAARQKVATLLWVVSSVGGTTRQLITKTEGQAGGHHTS